jgi:hypothetical protein
VRNRGHPHDQTLHDSTGEIGLNLPNTKLHGRDFSVPKFLEKKLGTIHLAGAKGIPMLCSNTQASFSSRRMRTTT